MTGDCDVSDECVSSSNYPQEHGNYESCSVIMLRDSNLTVGATFDLETCCDHLIIRGVDIEARNDFPSSLFSGETFTWNSDFVTATNGWQICFTALNTSSTSRGEACKKSCFLRFCSLQKQRKCLFFLGGGG